MEIYADYCTESKPVTKALDENSKITSEKNSTQEILTFSNNSNDNASVNNTYEAQELNEYVRKSLDLEDDFLEPSIIKENGTYYLKLSRAADDKLRAEQRQQFNMCAIKRSLGVEDGILNEHNNLADVTGRKLYANSDSGTIECGKSLKIPLKDLGQTSWYKVTHIFSTDITDYVENFLKENN